jgi:hypothetical protein
MLLNLPPLLNHHTRKREEILIIRSANRIADPLALIRAGGLLSLLE